MYAACVARRISPHLAARQQSALKESKQVSDIHLFKYV
jgi:hypothetical protein